jgi:diacylglycerol kinase
MPPWLLWFQRRFRAFRPALAGLRHLLGTEWNFRLHLTAAAGALFVGQLLRFEYGEWLVIVILTGLVLTAEALNTAIERLVGLLRPEIHPLARAAKDTAAAGVLLASITAAVAGFVIVGRHVGFW